MRPILLSRLLIKTGLASWLPGLHRWTEGATEYLRYFSDDVLAGPREELARVSASLFEPPSGDVVDLASATPRLELALPALPRLSQEKQTLPPLAGLPDLRTAVAERSLLDRHLPVSPIDEVLITHGATGAFQIAVEALVNPGTPVVVPVPASPLFILALRRRRARIRWLQTWVEAGRCRFKLDELARALRGARLMVLCSPANPTGAVIAAEDLEQLAWWADHYDVLLYADESLTAFAGEQAVPSLGTLERARRRTLTASSLSKSHGLAALRVGWLTGHRQLIRAALVPAALRSGPVPAVAQQLAVQALRQPPEVMQAARAELARRCRYAWERLEGMGLKPIWPECGFCVWTPLGVPTRAVTETLAREHRVKVAPGDLFGPGNDKHIRISVCPDEGRLREGLNRLAAALSGKSSREPRRQAA